MKKKLKFKLKLILPPTLGEGVGGRNLKSCLIPNYFV
jgi:hypothetical protein